MLVMAFIQGIVIKIYQLEKSCTLIQGCQGTVCAMVYLCTGHLI